MNDHNDRTIYCYIDKNQQKLEESLLEQLKQDFTNSWEKYGWIVCFFYSEFKIIQRDVFLYRQLSFNLCRNSLNNQNHENQYLISNNVIKKFLFLKQCFYPSCLEDTKEIRKISYTNLHGKGLLSSGFVAGLCLLNNGFTFEDADLIMINSSFSIFNINECSIFNQGSLVQFRGYKSVMTVINIINESSFKCLKENAIEFELMTEDEMFKTVNTIQDITNNDLNLKFVYNNIFEPVKEEVYFEIKKENKIKNKKNTIDFVKDFH